MAEEKNVTAATSTGTSGTDVNTDGGAAASVASANQFPYHVVVHSDEFSLLMTSIHRHRHFRVIFILNLKVI